MTEEIDELMDWVDQHPTDFKARIRLKELIRTYGEELDKQQEEELANAFIQH